MTQLLTIERGPGKGRRIELETFPSTVGRDPQNNIVLEDSEASRFHLRIKKRGRLYIVEDLESKNGTYINGDRIVNSILKSGDKILIGSTELTFMTTAASIHLAQEVLDFDMLIAENLGLTGPIAIGGNPMDGEFRPTRLAAVSDMHELSSKGEITKSVFDIQGNLLVIDDLEEASNTLLKSIGQASPSVSRAALFVWVEGNRQLVPIAARHFGNNSLPFLLSQRSLEDVLARKQGILLKSENNQTTVHAAANRIILPVIHNKSVVGLVHMESDAGGADFSHKEIELIQVLLFFAAASLESLLLRKEIDSWMLGMVETVIATIEAKDTYTVGHSERVCKYSMAIADELKLDRETKKLLMVSSLCHDIGKIGIPDSILKKASSLSADEYEEMKLHPTIGADIIKNMPNAQRFLSGVKYHHEKWDGTGYPDGLIGEEIPFFGRIVAVADVFDAMISGRSYSGFIDESDAVEKIQKEVDLFDPEIIRALVRAYDHGSLTQRTSTQSRDVGFGDNAQTVMKDLAEASLTNDPDKDDDKDDD